LDLPGPVPFLIFRAFQKGGDFLVSTTSLIALGIGLILAIFLVLGLGVLSLLSGTMEYFFGQPKLFLLKSKFGKNGLALGFQFNTLKEPAKYDELKVRLFNPFGTPTQAIIHRTFPAQSDNFSIDLDLGEEMQKMLSAKGFNDALVEITFLSSSNGISFSKSLKAFKFLKTIRNASLESADFLKKYKNEKTKPLYPQAERSFISPPLEGSGKALKMASNPEFAAQFATTAAAAPAAAKENFSVSKVWIAPGCIVCNACENIYPEVFEVTADTCIIRPNYPKNDGLKVQEAAEACPVEVIKFEKA
jgi:ferredoxin